MMVDGFMVGIMVIDDGLFCSPRKIMAVVGGFSLAAGESELHCVFQKDQCNKPNTNTEIDRKNGQMMLSHDQRLFMMTN